VIGACVFVLAVSLIRAVQVAKRLGRLLATGRRRIAASLFFSNPLLSLLAIYSAFYLVLYTITRNGFHAQGRNWFPCLLSILWLGAVYAPRVLRQHRLRRILATTFLGCLFVYTLALMPFESAAIRRRYYGEGGGFLPVSLAAPSRVTLGSPFVLQSRPGKK
jgi:hypothetical protein